MKENINKKEEIFLIDIQLISSTIFIIASIVSLLITYNEKLNITNRKKIFTNKEALNISFYNRIIILVVVVTSLYVGYKNYINEENNTIAKYKSSLLLSTNVLTLISAIVILYVSYLNKTEQSLTVSDIENPLIEILIFIKRSKNYSLITILVPLTLL